MSSLFSSLTSASQSLQAHSFGLDVTGQNIANVNTPGFSRRTVDLVSVGPSAAGSAGGGVSVGGVRALRDRLLDIRLQQEVPSQQRQAQMATSLSVVEASLGTPGSSIDKSLKNFFDSFARLSETPTSPTARQDVLLQADSLAGSFRSMAARLVSARQDADRQVRSSVEDANTLADQIASLNRSIAASPSPESTLQLRDEQGQAVRKLAEIIDISTLDRQGGGVDISVGNGRPLVIGDSAYDVTVTNTAPSGMAALGISGTTVTAEITGGRLGGLLEVRDVTVPGYQDRLDTLAYEVANQVNTIHSAGYDQSGAAAGNLFAYSSAPVGTTGAAAALMVDSTVAADSRLLSAAAIANGGDNQNARSIAALREQKVLNGNTQSLSDLWGDLVYRVGRDTKTATDEAASGAEVVSQVDALRDQVSGVSLDEEAANLLKFQRAYEANARFFSVIDRTLDLLMTHLGQ